MENRFATLDLYLAAFIVLNGHQAAFETEGGKVVFVFKDVPTIMEIVDRFNRNTPIAVADFTTAIKRLRGQMLQMKGSSSRAVIFHHPLAQEGKRNG